MRNVNTDGALNNNNANNANAEAVDCENSLLKVEGNTLKSVQLTQGVFDLP